MADLNFIVRQVPYAAVDHLHARAARERVSISNTGSTRWFAALADDALVGAAGLWQTTRYYRVKGIWVDPEWRGRGVGSALTEMCVAIAIDECAPAIDAFAWNPAYWTGRGFAVIGRLSNGAAHVRKRL